MTSLSAAMTGLALPAAATLGGLGLLIGVAEVFTDSTADMSASVDDLTASLQAAHGEINDQVSLSLARLLTETTDTGDAFKKTGADVGVFVRDIANGAKQSRDTWVALSKDNEVTIDAFRAKMADGTLASNEFNNELLRLANTGKLTDDELYNLLIATRDGSDAFNEAKGTAESLSGALNDTAEKTRTLDEATKHLHDTMHAQIDPLFAMQKALQENQQALYDAAAAGDQNAEKNQKVAESSLAVHDASLQLSEAMKNGTVSVQGAKDMLNQWVAQGLMTQAQADSVAASLDGLAWRAAALDGRNIDLTVNVHAGHIDIPDLGLAANKDFHAAASGFTGTVTRPTLFLAGEGGSAEDVYIGPHGQRGGGAGGSSPVGAGGNTYNVTINGSNLTAEQLVSAIKDYERRNGTGWRN